MKIIDLLEIGSKIKVKSKDWFDKNCKEACGELIMKDDPLSLSNTAGILEFCDREVVVCEFSIADRIISSIKNKRISYYISIAELGFGFRFPIEFFDIDIYSSAKDINNFCTSYCILDCNNDCPIYKYKNEKET